MKYLILSLCLLCAACCTCPQRQIDLIMMPEVEAEILRSIDRMQAVCDAQNKRADLNG